jgi:ATP-dependent helicase/nuclease subunit B
VLFDAPNAYSEVEMAARELVREHERHGVDWSSCLIVVRSIGDYEALLSGLLSRYDVPFAFRRGRPLIENAAVRSIVQLMRVYLGGWKREDVIEFLRVDPIGISGIGVDVARVIARSRGARQGRAAWEGLIDRLKEANEKVGAAVLQMLDLEHRFPPREEKFDRFADAVRAAVMAFGLDEPAGHSDASREDRLAIKLALDGLQQMERQARLSEAPPAAFARHFRRLHALWKSLTFMPSEPARAVSIIEPYDAQQLRPRVACVLGMTERVFPRRIKEDPFFQDDEREILRRHASIDLEPQRERADDERLLFYLAATTPTERLILSMPRSSEESDTLPSFFLSEARAALEAAGESLPAVVRMLSDVAPSEQDCVSGHDRILAAADAARELADSAEAPPAIAEILATRERPPLPALTDDSIAGYSARRRYSVTEIETYNRCPLQHFFKYGLKLRVDAEGAGALDRGALHHDTLRRTLRAWAATGDTIEKRKLYESMVKQMVDCLNERSVDAKPHRKALMERAVRGALEVCAEREERYRDIFQMSPTHFELAFGMEDREDEEGRTRDYDAASRPDPLVFTDENGEPVHLCGAIDRVDLASDGRTAMVMDYKMGGTTEWAEIKDGKSIQIPVYLMAVEQIWDFVGAVGCYDSPRDTGRRRFYRKDLVDARAFQPLPGVEDGRLAKPVGSDEYQQALDAAQHSVRSAVAGMRAGDILPTPGDHCRWCDFTDACRTTPDGTHDGQPLPTPELSADSENGSNPASHQP